MGKLIRGINDLATVNPELAKQWNHEKNDNLKPDMVTPGSGKKVWWICKEGHEWHAQICGRNRGQGCPYCSGRQAIKGKNDLVTVNPDLAKEWNYEKNDELTPDMFLPSSNIKVWWTCPKGHEWKAIICHRSKGTGCPVCTGKQVLKGYNDLTKTNKKLAKEWSFEKNGDLLPSAVTAGSAKKVWWKCSKCGYTWRATIANRAYLGQGCPFCVNRDIVPGMNDLATTDPHLAKEWDYESNAPLLPTQAVRGSRKKVFWICPAGHRYQATIYHRAKDGTGCPICASARQTSFAEQAVLFYIRKNHPDAISRYTDIFTNGMELDIYIPSLKTAVEYDGAFWHNGIREREERKYQICQEHGIKLIRIREGEDRDCRGIADACYHMEHLNDHKKLAQMISFFISNLEIWNPDYSARLITVDLERDGNEIRKYMTDLSGNSLAEIRPDLVEEWCQEKNGDLTPQKVSKSSGIKVYWQCKKCGHIWKSAISNRFKNTGCPKCSLKQNSGASHRGAKKIYQYSRDGEFIKEWGCITDAARAVGISQPSIYCCAVHRQKTAGGYRWEYYSTPKLEPLPSRKKTNK